MYFIDRNQIEHTLVYMEKMLDIHQEMNVPATEVEKLAFERLAHVVVEGILDVGNSIIDGFIMRDPGSYEDIIDILMDEKVLSSSNGEKLKIVVRLRKELVQNYTVCDTLACWHTFGVYKEEIAIFPQMVRDYLENELGPVTAFMP